MKTRPMTDTQIKDRIISLILSTGREGAQRTVDYLLRSDFFTASCHHHHKFIGGLAKHSLEAYEIAVKVHKDMPEDSLILTTLLHDLCTARHTSTDHIHGHGYRSVRILKEVCGLDITHEESNAIRYHMHPNAKQTQGNLLAGVVSAADIFSATHGIVDRIYRLVG